MSYDPTDFEFSNAVSTQVSGPERLAAAASHASLVLGIPFVIPLLVLFFYPMLQPSSAYVRAQALQSLMFHLFLAIVGGVLGALAAIFFHIILIGWPFAAACALGALGVIVWGSIVELIAMVKTFRGKPYRLPVVGGWSS